MKRFCLWSFWFLDISPCFSVSNDPFPSLLCKPRCIHAVSPAPPVGCFVCLGHRGLISCICTFQTQGFGPFPPQMLEDVDDVLCADVDGKMKVLAVFITVIRVIRSDEERLLIKIHFCWFLDPKMCRTEEFWSGCRKTAELSWTENVASVILFLSAVLRMLLQSGTWRGSISFLVREEVTCREI